MPRGSLPLPFPSGGRVWVVSPEARGPTLPSRGVGGPRQHTLLLVWTASRPDGALSFPLDWAAATRGQPRLAPERSGGVGRRGPPYRGGSGGATRPVHRSAARKLGTSNLSAVRRPRSRSPSARPRVPNSPPSSGGRRGVQCLHPRSAPVERGGAPGGPVVSFPILILSPNTGTRRKPQNQTNVTTLSGGSLGSCVDEERS